MLWTVRLLVLLGCGLMIYSFMQPWWTVNLSNIPWKDPIKVYAFGFRHDLIQMAAYVAIYATPFYQTVIAYIYLWFSVILALCGTFLKGKKGAFLLGGIGVGYIAYALGTRFMIKSGIPRISATILGYSGGNVPIPLQGSYSIGLGLNQVKVVTAFHPAYYLAYATGIVFIILALIYFFIKHRTKKTN